MSSMKWCGSLTQSARYVPKPFPLTNSAVSPPGFRFMTMRLPSASFGSVTVPLNQQYSQSLPQVNPGSTGWNAAFWASSKVRYSIVGNASQEISPNGS